MMGPQHKFSLVPRATIERSVFDRSHGYKTTFNAGLLIPIFRKWAACGLTLIMVGAAYTHAVNTETAYVLVNLVLALLCASVIKLSQVKP